MPPDTSRNPSPASADAEGRGVGHDLVGVLGEARVGRLAERDGLGGDHVLERSALPAREHRLVDRLGVLLTAHDGAATRTAQRLVRGERDDVGVRHGVGVGAADDEAGDVGGIEHEQRADLVGDRAERLGLEATGIARGAGDDHLGPVLDAPGRAAGPCRSARRHRPPGRRRSGTCMPLAFTGEPWVRWPAVVEAEAEHGVARLEQGLVHAHVGVGAASVAGRWRARRRTATWPARWPAPRPRR